MTPKEKAISLVEKYKPYCDYEIGKIEQQTENAKACAIICVNEIIAEYKKLEKRFNGDFKQLNYWQEAKKQIEFL